MTFLAAFHAIYYIAVRANVIFTFFGVTSVLLLYRASLFQLVFRQISVLPVEDIQMRSWLQVSCVALGSALALSAVNAVAAPSTHPVVNSAIPTIVSPPPVFKLAGIPTIVSPKPVFKLAAIPTIVSPPPVFKLAGIPTIVSPKPVFKLAAIPTIVSPKPVFKLVTNV